MSDFFKLEFTDIIDVLDYHKNLLPVNPDIRANSHLNIKDDIFLIVSIFSSFDDNFEDDLSKMLIDDILNLLKYFDSINYNQKNGRTFSGNTLEDMYKNIQNDNTNVSLEDFKSEYFRNLKDLRTEAIPIINTKLYYFDLLIWKKARESKLILKVLGNLDANDCFNTKDFTQNKGINFKSMVSYKYISNDSEIKPRYNQEDLKYLLTLNSENDDIDSSYEENFNRLIGVKNKIEIFKGMLDGDIRTVVKDVNFMKFNPHETIIREGELGEEIFFLVSGICRVSANNKPVGLLNQHQIFGEFSAITKDLRTATIRTNSVVTVLSFKLSTDLFDEMPESFSVLYKNIIDELIKKIDLSNQKKF